MMREENEIRSLPLVAVVSLPKKRRLSRSRFLEYQGAVDTARRIHRDIYGRLVSGAWYYRTDLPKNSAEVLEVIDYLRSELEKIDPEIRVEAVEAIDADEAP